MQLITLILVLATTSAFADISPKAEPLDFGLSTPNLKKLRKKHEAQTDSAGVSSRVASSFEAQDYMSAVYTDQAMQAIINQAAEVLDYYGYEKDAASIKSEYARSYTTAFSGMFLGDKELGDHPPMSVWLDTVHKRIEDSIGEYLCKFFHLHDMYVLNYGFPSILRPGALGREDYMDAFAGHLIWGWFWEHHGVSGVVTYWLVNGACSMGTAGMGVVAFICGPISGFAETSVDKYLAPKIGGRIWELAHSQAALRTVD